MIPARIGSTRLPGKMLLAQTGRPLIAHVVEQARRARRLRELIVATDDARIASAVESLGCTVRMTRADHATGSDRIGEILPSIAADVVVNIQGDEPEIDPDLLDEIVARLETDAQAAVATAATPITSDSGFRSPNFVKVVVDAAGRALYFSRSPVPGSKTGAFPEPPPLLHVGVYAYRRSALEAFLALPPSGLERTESLEQLRLLEAGFRFAVVVVPKAPRGIDTADDYAEFVRRVRESAPRG